MWGYRHGWMMNGEGMGFGFLFWLVNLAMIIAGAVWFAVTCWQSATARAAFPSLWGPGGEIDREEYLQKKRDIID